MRFTILCLMVVLCANSWAAQANDEDIVAAAEKLVQEAKETKAIETVTAQDGAVAPTATASANTTMAGTTATAVTTATVEPQSEANTPVNLKTEKPVKAEENLAWRLIASFIFIAVVGGAMIFASRRWKRDGNKGGEKARIEILHQFHLTPKRSLVLVRVAGEALLIGSTDSSVNMIKSIALIDGEMDDVAGKDFNGFLEDEFSIEDVRSALTNRN